MSISAQRLQQNFSRAAGDYDARAEFQHIQTRRVLDAALMVFPHAAMIADIGCGTGYFAYAAKDKRPGWNILGIDIAAGMCEVAATRSMVIAGDAARLPLAERSVDAAVSSLCYQWVENHTRAFDELFRVLKPGGRAVIATLGAATLHELHDAAAMAEVDLALLPMRAFETTKHALNASGLELLLADCACETRYYPNVSALLDSMRSIGAGNNFSSHATRKMTPGRFAALTHHYEKHRAAQGIPATWEHQFFVLGKPQ